MGGGGRGYVLTLQDTWIQRGLFTAAQVKYLSSSGTFDPDSGTGSGNEQTIVISSCLSSEKRMLAV